MSSSLPLTFLSLNQTGLAFVLKTLSKSLNKCNKGMNRMEFKLSPAEKKDLLKAWIAISIAFAIAFGGGISGVSLDIRFLLSFLVAGLTVGIGFIAHELSHKLLAIKYGCSAEFRSFDQMLILAIIFSFFGFILAAPGGVFIKGRITPAQNGKVSAAGIVANLVVAFLFLVLALLVPVPPVQVVAGYGVLINSWLALFNLLPFLNFDGKKVLAWNKTAYGALIAAGIILMFLSSEIAIG
jgi:Zn-dependent protease